MPGARGGPVEKGSFWAAHVPAEPMARRFPVLFRFRGAAFVRLCEIFGVSRVFFARLDGAGLRARFDVDAKTQISCVFGCFYS